MSGENSAVQEEKFRLIIASLDIAQILNEPISNSIVNLLKVFPDQVSCDKASVIMRDGDMKFLAAIGKAADQVVNLGNAESAAIRFVSADG